MATPMDFICQIMKENPLKPIYRNSKRIEISKLIKKCKVGGTGSAFVKTYLDLVKGLQRTINQIQKEGYEQNLEETIVYGEVKYKLNQAIEVLKNGLRNSATLYAIIRALENDKDSERIILLALFLILEDKHQERKNLFIRNRSDVEIIESDDGTGIKLFDKIYKKAQKTAKRE